LNAEGCEKLSSFPPLKLDSLQELELSYCTSLNKFPEILGKMKNLNKIILGKTSIKEFPFSFHNLTELQYLLINGHGELWLPSSILMIPNLSDVTINGYSQLLAKPNDKRSYTLSSNVRDISLEIRRHDFLTIALTWFSNVETLSLKGSDIKVLPECLKNCRFLKSIKLDGCKYLKEIRGIPPYLKILFAFGCKSLTSSSKSKLMSQVLLYFLAYNHLILYFIIHHM
jgi:Leucine-rich repeat (LRR) protein